jgi:hypothetical protein
MCTARGCIGLPWRFVTSIARRELADLLRDVRGGGSFSTRHTAPFDDLAIEVRGVGPIRLPVTVGQAKELRLVARPARYGKGEETLVDRRVRDTWEVPHSRVTIDKRRWASTLRPILDRVRHDLGLPATSTVEADLHSMLVYEPGQFFAAHQDSEKDDAMFGSLVVLLPSRSTGGELVISHQGRTVTYAGSATALTFIAFYADTRHEVLPVERGYRVALTYNLRLTGESGLADVAAPELTTFGAELLGRHFADVPEPRWHNDSSATEPPDRLVFLLDHQYSERGLRWAQLKGDDAARAGLLRGAAEHAGCEAVLALAEIQETRDCEDAPRGRRRWSDWDDDDAPSPSDAIGELLDSSVMIAPADGTAAGFDPHVTEAELAESTPSADLVPYDTEYTGNMGNYGNTMDRWYRRAAIVIWPRSRSFAVRAKGDPAVALDELLVSATGGLDAGMLAEMVSMLLRYWPEGVRRHDPRELLPRTLVLVRHLGDAQSVSRFLEPFMVEAVAPTDARSILALADRYGAGWFERQLSTWMAQRFRSSLPGLPTRAQWVESLPELYAALAADELATVELKIDVARSLTNSAWNWLRTEIEQAPRITKPSAQHAALVGLGSPLLSVIRTAAKVDAPDLCSAIVDTVCDPTIDVTLMLLGSIDASTRLTPTELAMIDLRPLALHCATALHTELARPERAAADWSIIDFARPQCCADCAKLQTFLESATDQQLVWPLAQTRRQHIHQRIDQQELPVTHQTRHEGSPHKLVLTKTSKLFTDHAQNRANAKAALTVIERFLDRP